ncbi:hypothetical protein LSH36_192g04037 [Paralvinella palmiformis]|uniref:Centriolar satellite-associated tubulin polyglutamylase complex regulator 1 n=1 Tax=Paralvinella palmiformis TaxID=53620 RepID=A0AAD9JQN5_9ANNE|nr:hypothetical protein LSH36_192g04037 [Paralvinella palmiformis]
MWNRHNYIFMKQQQIAVTKEEKHHVLTYIEDAISQLLEHKETNSKVNTAKFFSDYFSSVKEGNHVLFREYSYVHATPHNRACFVRTFWKCFRNIGKKGDLLSVKEYHSLLCLLCPDFPFSVVLKTARIILMDDAMDCHISFSDFLYAFQVQSCFDEFLSKCAEIYKELQNNPQVSPDTVVVPTSEERAAPVHAATNGPCNNTEGVDANLFHRLLIPVCEKLDKYAPSPVVLKELLSAASRVTFYGFLMAMAKCEALNTSIGKLPNKGELLDISDPELTLESPAQSGADVPSTPPIRPGSAANKTRPSSGQLRPLLSAQGSSILTNSSGVSLASKPPSSTCRGCHKPMRTASRRPRVLSTESDDDDDDSASTTD